MREGRRQRLGLQEGTEGTVQDTYLDRILEEAGPRTLALDPDAFVDTTDQRYVQDAYNYYLGGGFPEEPEPVIDTPVVDTTPVVDASGGGGQDLATGSVDTILDTGDAPINVDTPLTQMITTPTGDTMTVKEAMTSDDAYSLDTPSFDDQFQDIEDIQQTYGKPIDIGYGEGQVDPRLAAGLEEPIIDTSSVPPTITAPSGDVFAADDPLAMEKIDFQPEQQGLVDQAFSKVGSTAETIMDDLSKIPGAIANFAEKTVDIAGKKINVGKTLFNAGLNKIVGGPISLVFDALGAIGGMLPDGIETTTNKAREIGLIQGDNTVTQDIYGINTQSMFGDYNQYNIDRVEQLEDKVNKTPRDITELQQRKDYIDSSGALGDIDDDPTGDAQIAEQIEADNRAAEADRIEAERRALQEINAAAAREQAAAEQRARDETDARMAAEAASRAAAAAAAAREAARNQGGGNNGGGGQNTGGARGGGTSATSSGLGNLGFSDIRLKDNVELIGKSPSNINIYKFNYKGDSTVYEGVIANEIPWASVEASNGYLMVDYNKIDVELKKHAKR